MSLSVAERLLQDIGVSEPGEIDLEAIAFYLNASVRYRPLEGCEARIIGSGDKAIITIRDSSMRRRQRFSLAHEIGHWTHDAASTSSAGSRRAARKTGCRRSVSPTVLRAIS